MSGQSADVSVGELAKLADAVSKLDAIVRDVVDELEADGNGRLGDRLAEAMLVVDATVKSWQRH